VSESEPSRPVRVEIMPSAAEQARLAATRDRRLGADAIAEAARLAVAAWAMAVDGDGAALAAMAEPAIRDTLIQLPWNTWRVAPGPRVTSISIWALEADNEPVRMRLGFRCTGRRRYDAGSAGASTSQEAAETEFAGLIDLTLTGTGPSPWRISSGQVKTLDEYLGYVFTSRRETPEERDKRAASGAARVPAGPGRDAFRPTAERTFRLTAGFAEHDERLGSAATIDVRRETAPPRDEAERLIRPAVWAVTTSALGDGDWNPTLNWLDVIELLD
jgi:hypothetical protein